MPREDSDGFYQSYSHCRIPAFTGVNEITGAAPALELSAISIDIVSPGQADPAVFVSGHHPRIPGIACAYNQGRYRE